MRALHDGDVFTKKHDVHDAAVYSVACIVAHAHYYNNIIPFA